MWCGGGGGGRQEFDGLSEEASGITSAARGEQKKWDTAAHLMKHSVYDHSYLNGI